MTGCTRSERNIHIVAFCIVALCIVPLLFIVVWPDAAAAQVPGDALGPGGGGPQVGQATSTPTPTPSPTPTPISTITDDNPHPPTPIPTATRDGQGQTTGPDQEGSGGTPTPDPNRSDYELLKALAPNRIVFHAATPAQLIKVEDGLQYYFIGSDGKTRLGPWIPPFAELAEKYPDGEEASIYFGFNPLTGKSVKIDYLPSVNRIRVDTFYADRDGDRNKSYIFHFGPEHDITYDVW